MLYDETAVRENIRNREGRRVFYLGKADTLTPSARDWLAKERIPILPAEQAKPERYRLPGGGYMEEKPEHMTHLDAQILVPKTHPRIAFRGKLDTLEGELMLCKLRCPREAEVLEELLELTRRLIRCDVLSEPVGDIRLCGLTEDQQRQRSHFPQNYYGQPHFMPRSTDGEAILWLNRCRCLTREAELAAAAAFRTQEGTSSRPDILQAMNRMSSMLYLLMIRQKAKQKQPNSDLAGRSP